MTTFPVDVDVDVDVGAEAPEDSEAENVVAGDWGLLDEVLDVETVIAVKFEKEVVVDVILLTALVINPEGVKGDDGKVFEPCGWSSAVVSISISWLLMLPIDATTWLLRPHEVGVHCYEMEGNIWMTLQTKGGVTMSFIK